MTGSMRIGTFFGIPVMVHWTFFLLFLWVAYAGTGRVFGWQAYIMESGLILALFICVVLHEFGHALTARRFGVETRDIILSPIGGVARLERLPEKPLHEFYIAIAGPLVNILIAIILSPFLLFFDLGKFIQTPYRELLSDLNFFLPWLIVTNLILAIFNLVPAFPMDGGRVFRSLLAIWIGRLKATRVASTTAQILSVCLFGFSAYHGQLMPALIAAFIFLMATQEYRAVYTDSLLKQVTVREVFRSEYNWFYENQPLAAVIDKILPPDSLQETDFLIMDENNMLCGTLEKGQVLKALKEGRALEDTLAGYTSRKYVLLSPEESLSQAWSRMGLEGVKVAGVWEMEAIIGVLDYRMIDEYLQFQEAIPGRYNLRSVFTKTPLKKETGKTESVELD